MNDINAKRLEALEWAMRKGLAITESYRGGFVASAECDEDKTFARGETLADLADQLGRIRERMEARACPACRGTGKFPGRGGTEDCVRCNGTGTVWTEGAT